jgi:hypothetical protein
LAAAGAILAAWLVVRISAADALASANPYAASKVAAGDPRIATAIAMTEFRTQGGRVSEEAKRNAMQAAYDAPLAEEPYLFAAVDALLQNDRERADRLLLAGRQRDPRSDMTRLLLLDSFLRRGLIVEATEEIGALAGVAPRAGSLLIGELARLAQAPDTVGALESALRKNPAFRNQLLDHLAANNADPDLVLRLARNVPAPPGSSSPAPWQTQLVTSIAERGEIARAYGLWRTFYAPRAPEKKDGVYDGRFQGLPGTGPFAWQFPASPAGVAERTGARTLQVDYYGRDAARMVEQLLMLPPGKHRLSVRAEGDAEGEGSKLNWRIECRPSKAQIADLLLRNLTYTPRVMTADFTVPSGGCSAQWLRLEGTAGEFPKAQTATISAINIEAAR